MINGYSYFVNFSQLPTELYIYRSMKWHTAMRRESQMSHCKKNGDTNPAKSELTYCKSQHFQKSFFGQEVPRAVPALRSPTQELCPRNLKLPYTLYIQTYIVYNMIHPNNSKRSHQKFLSIKGLRIRHLHFITPQSFLLCKRKALI